MKNASKVTQNNVQIFGPNSKYKLSLIILLLCTIVLTAQKQYKLDDFFYATVPEDNPPHQVVLYDDFLSGASKNFPIGEWETLGELNDRVSSLIVPKGLKVTCYFNKNFSGNKTEFLPGAYVSNWHSNDNWESMKVERIGSLDGAYFLQSDAKPTDPGWGNKVIQGLGQGRHNYLKNELICNDCWSYLWVIGDVQVIVYDGANFSMDYANNLHRPFEDTSTNKTGTMYDLRNYGYANKISSVDIMLYNYGLYNVERVAVGSPERLPNESLNLGRTICNDNPDKTNVTLTTGISQSGSKTVTTSLSNNVSVNFSITHTQSLSVGIQGFGEASVSTAITAEAGTAIEWGTTNETALEESLSLDVSDVIIPYGQAMDLEYYTVPTKQRYKETYYYRPLKPTPNANNKYDFTADAASREKTVEVDVFEVRRTQAVAVPNRRKCTQAELGITGSSVSDSSDNTNNSNASSTTSSDNSNTNSNTATASTNNTTETTEPTKDITGRNTKYVAYSGGSFVQVNPNTWHEKNSAGQTTFDFEEVNRDDWTVYLFDKDRNMHMTLNLWKKEISYMYKGDASYSKLYDIAESK